MGLDGLSLNSYWRVGYWEGENGVAYWCMPLLHFLFFHSLFFPSLSIFSFWFICYLFSFLSFFFFFFFFFFCFFSFSLFLTYFSLLSLVLALFPVHSQGLYILPIVMGFTVLPLNYFCLGVGVLPKPPTGLSAIQPSPLPYAGHATFHSQTKECCFVFLLSMAFPSG